MRSAPLLLVAIVACGPGARFDAQSETPAAQQDVPLDVELAPLGLPDMDGKPFVRVLDGGGTREPSVLLEDAPDHFAVFDGVERRVYDTGPSGAPDAAPPPRFERVAEREVARSLSKGDGIAAIVFASVLRKRGYESEARSVLDEIAKDPKALRAIVRENVAVRWIDVASERYARGATREDYERRLERAAAMKDTEAAATADALLKASRAPKLAPTRQTAIDDLVQLRIEELADMRCERESYVWDHQPLAIARLVALGFTARAALERAKDDTHPSRCLLGGVNDICEIDPAACPKREHVERIIPLVTVGELARRALDEIDGHHAFDASDIECRGGDSIEATELTQTNDAIDLAKASLGKLRAKMVEVVGKSNDARTTAFLVGEATSGPVLAARVRAADALRVRGDKRWAGMIANAIDAAFRSRDSDQRCDRPEVAFRLKRLIDAAPNEALGPIVASFATYDARAKIDVVYDVLTSRTTPVAGASDVVALALADTHSTSMQMSFTVGTPREVRPHVLSGRNVHCDRPSPSDIAATFLGEKLRVAYACTDSASDKSLAVQKILAQRAKW